jgi:hypothetical protein
MERFVLNGSERTDGCFTAAFPLTQHASFSVRCGGRTAVGGGNGTRKNTHICLPARARLRQNNRTATSLRLPLQAGAHIMDIDFEIFDCERLITEVEKRRAPYS